MSSGGGRELTGAGRRIRSLGGSEVLRISLLGCFRVRTGSRIIEEDEWRLKKAASLVKLLALVPGHRLHREQVMDLFWPDQDPRAAANNLRYALHYARRSLKTASVAAPDHLRVRDEQLALSVTGGLWVDVEAFEEAAATARRARVPAAYLAALNLYGGDLLPGDRYEEWAEGRRAQLRTLYLALLVEMAGLYEERDDHGPAIEAFSKAIQSEPTHEMAHVGLMRLYAISGRRAEAIRQYGRLSEVLKRNLAAEPDPASRHLYEEIQAGRYPPAGPSDVSPLPAEPPSVGLHNLPVARTSFVGREREVGEVRRTLALTALLTLTGAGGSGKTRLALEAARDLVGAYPDGVWFVELAPLTDSELVAQAVFGVLGVREQQNRPLLETLVGTLQKKNMLLVLDNCEHLVDGAARLADTLLDSCPDVHILATSREPLGIAGEVSWPVVGLSLPDAEHPLTVEELEGYESARLFVERALYRPSAFALTPENARAVVQICRQLDGIPLAIELAASRVGALAVEQISERLSDSLELLTGGGRTVTARQQTLRGALNWSYELLNEQERNLFVRLSVFSGGWTLEAAEVVGVGDGIEREGVLDLISRLGDKSLVVAEPGENGALRYRMLETVRQYVREKLEGSGKSDAVRRRHALWFLALAEEAEPELTGGQQGLWIDRLEAEHDNLRTALRWLLERREIEPTLRLCGALGEFWHMRGYLSEGRRWLEGALGMGSGPGVLRINGLSGAALMGWEQGEFERSVVLSEESLTLCRETGDMAGAAVALSNLGMAALFREKHGEAEALFEEAVALRRELGDEAGLARALQALGLTVMSQGDFEHAEALYEEGLAWKTGDVLGTELLLLGLALAALGQGEYGRARAYSTQVLDTSLPMSYRHSTAACLHVLAAAAGSEGQAFRATRLWGAAEALREAIGTPDLSPVERTFYARHIAAAGSRLDEKAWRAAWAEGRKLTPEQAIEYGLPTEEPTLPAAFTLAPEVPAAPAGSNDATWLGSTTEMACDEATPARLKALTRAGRLACEQGDYVSAITRHEESLRLHRRTQNKPGIALSLSNLGLVALYQGDRALALRLHEESLTLRREMRDTRGIAASLHNLGLLALYETQYVRARTLFDGSLPLFRKLGDEWAISILLNNLGLVALHQGDHKQAVELQVESLVLRQELKDKGGVAECLEGLSGVAGAQGGNTRAARLWAAAEAIRGAIGAPSPPAHRSLHKAYIDTARSRLSETAWVAASEEGRKMTLEQAIDYALSVEKPIASEPERSPADGQRAVLTPREGEIAILLAHGLSDRGIASELSISNRTVTTHVGKILRKLGFRSRSQVAAWAAEQRLLTPDQG